MYRPANQRARRWDCYLIRKYVSKRQSECHLTPLERGQQIEAAIVLTITMTAALSAGVAIRFPFVPGLATPLARVVAMRIAAVICEFYGLIGEGGGFF